MRRSFLGLAAALLGSSMVQAFQHAAMMADSRHRIDFTRVGSRTYRTGKKYPHSSARQRARYARQIAAGQIGG